MSGEQGFLEELGGLLCCPANRKTILGAVDELVKSEAHNADLVETVRKVLGCKRDDAYTLKSRIEDLIAAEEKVDLVDVLSSMLGLSDLQVALIRASSVPRLTAKRERKSCG